MLPSINKFAIGDRRAFTLVETLTTTFIVIFVLLSVWSIYLMGWKWWHEMEPIVDAQRIARIALSRVVDGAVDSSAGEETISGNDYGFRNGIAWATITNEDYVEDPSFVTPVISAGGHRIDFKLEQDASAINGRAYYVDTDDDSGAMALYYQDNAGSVHKVTGTEIGAGQGNIDLTFEGDSGGYSSLVKVTVTVEKTIPGTKYESSPLEVECSDYVYLRNS